VDDPSYIPAAHFQNRRMSPSMRLSFVRPGHAIRIGFQVESNLIRV
jgi:hypothetical protein